MVLHDMAVIRHPHMNFWSLFRKYIIIICGSMGDKFIFFNTFQWFFPYFFRFQNAPTGWHHNNHSIFSIRIQSKVSPWIICPSQIS